ncbi:major capsid protein [Apis mellifera associated microvirus 61]|nr:major capsid protein [Apis mellifera associated microvirus 61]
MYGQSNMHVQGPQINQFNNIAPEPVPRSMFKRDFTRRSTFDPDYLVPIFLDEILPGDEVNLKMNAFVRMSTPIKPLMDNLYLETFWFFVPNRLVWDNWEKFQGQQTNPGDSVDYTIPVLDDTVAPLSTTGFPVESIYDYFGLPVLVTGIEGISCLFNRAYDLIWNEWFRDENLQNSLTVPTGDGPDDPANYTLRKRNKRKDYFTSMLPWPQKGDAVMIPLAGSAPVISNGQVPKLQATSSGNFGNLANSNTIGLTLSSPSGSIGNEDLRFYTTNTGLEADLDAVSALSINVLRQSALYQQILELDARGGTRYVESVYSRFGVILPDFRVQRPELLGQGSTRINIYAVPQTAPSTDDSPQGNLAAFGTAQISGNHGCRYAATEHGMLIGLANVRADLTYQQGVPKKFLRSTRLDFYEPLQNGLGEQSVLNKELYAQGTSADEDVAGYQERFAEYRWFNSEVTGKFRSVAPTTLDVWHLSQEFGSLPLLNSSFITEDVPMDRVLATGSTEPAFLYDAHYSYTHVRPMPIRSNPGIRRL